MKASDWIADYIAAQGVTHVYELVGGMITHLIDSIHRRGAPNLVSVKHEQAASFAAEIHGRVTGVPGVAMGTSGPGAVNLLTGIGSCFFDSAPAVFITGQVNRHEQKGQRGVRQLGFQETDIVAMARPITKAAFSVREAGDIPTFLGDAFRIALSGRPGPVLVDIPMDLQRADVEAPILRAAGEGSPIPSRVQVDDVLEVLSRAARPLILVGGGLRASRARAEFRLLVDLLGVPVVHSLMAVDALPWGHPLRVGFIGSYGNRWVNAAVGRSDAIMVLGSRLDIRQTGADTPAWKEGRTIAHVDADSAEINNRIKDCLGLNCDLAVFIREALTRAKSSSRPPWIEEINELRARWPDTEELRQTPGINPNAFLHALSRRSAGAAGYLVDVGQHQMWAAQSIELGMGQDFHTSGGMGAMGFALPGAIGACFARPGKPWVVVAGDGGFQLNIQELQTIAHHRLPIKVVVLNNGCQGMVRQFQESYFEKRYASTLWGYSAPDFAGVARAYGISSACVETSEGVAGGLESLWADPLAPFVLDLRVDTFTNAYPKIAFGLPMTEMEPLASPIEIEST